MFASDDWRLICKQLEMLSQSKIIINPLYDDNALISFDKVFHPRISSKRKSNGRLGANSRSNLKNGSQFDIVGPL